MNSLKARSGLRTKRIDMWFTLCLRAFTHREALSERKECIARNDGKRIILSHLGNLVAE
jgi:hypothetical protein